MANGNRDRKEGEAANQQHARFVEAACEAGADVDTSAADALMGRLAKTPPESKEAGVRKVGASAPKGESK